jgi:drug/metabolite transporter (DMT)-like permease
VSTVKRDPVPYFRLLGAQLAVGAAAIFARFALTGAGPLAVSAWRLVLAAVPLGVLAVLTRGGQARPGARREAALALAGLALAAHFAGWITSLLYAPVAISTLLVCTSPLWTGAFEAVRSRKAPPAAYLLGLALAAGGVAAIAGGREAAAPEPGHALLGALLALAGGLALAVYFLLVRTFGNAPVAAPALSTRAVVARTYAWAALALLAASAFAHQAPPAVGDWRAWAGILAMALISQGLGHTGMNAALRDFSPNVVALTTLLEPPIAALLAVWVFHETLGGLALAGAVAVLAGVGLALAGDARQ